MLGEIRAVLVVGAAMLLRRLLLLLLLLLLTPIGRSRVLVLVRKDVLGG